MFSNAQTRYIIVDVFACARDRERGKREKREKGREKR